MNAAFRAALAAERRSRRLEFPQGSFDAWGRWHPSEEERRPCCEQVRKPSRHWAWSLLRHCTTVKHCAALYEADEAEVRRVRNIIALLPNELLLPVNTPEELITQALKRIEGNRGQVVVIYDIVRTVAERLGVVRNWEEEWARVCLRIRAVPLYVAYLDELIEQHTCPSTEGASTHL